MPKASKTNKVDARASPMKVTGDKKKKVKKVTIVTSKNHVLPASDVVLSPTAADALEALTKFKDNTTSAEVEFDSFFVRQDQFGRFQFNITEDEYDTLDKVIKDDLEYDGNKTCIQSDGYSGHFQIHGKLSKEYLEEHKDTEVPIPADKSKVHVTGQIKVSKIKNEPVCYFHITAFHAIA